MNKFNYGINNGSYKHGLRKHPLWSVWRDMKQRCTNSSNKFYRYYGGRGIIVCDEWKKDFKSFYDWAMLNCWQVGLEIDRIDNNGNYESNNCRFVDRRKNASNTSKKSIYGTGVTKNGKNFTVRIRDLNGQKQCCGTYKTTELASKVYKLSLLAIKLRKS